LAQNEKIRLGILFGGRSGEHEVSLMSSNSVFKVLDPERYAVTPIGITREGHWVVGENIWQALGSGNTQSLRRAVLLPEPRSRTLYVQEMRAGQNVLTPYVDLDVIFPVLHGTFGEDGTLQGLFEMIDVAYVGGGVLASSVGMDKALFKDVMRANDIPVVNSILVTRNEIEKHIEKVLAQAENVAAYPLFVKPVNMGSSVGVSKCRNRPDLLEGLMDAAQYDRRILIERGVNAREIEVSVLGNSDPMVSIPGEIVPGEEFYSYTAKYAEDSQSLLEIPARLDPALTRRIQDLALQAYRAIDGAGMARVDFLLDKDSQEVFISEVNTIPGFTQISMYPKLWEASGIPYPQLIDRLVDLAFERKAERDRTVYQYGRSK
jgi:D-alanine-D-alanine ligase